MSKTPKTDELVRMEQSGEYFGELVETAIVSLRTAENTIASMVEWLEKNQPDVFRRGLWDAITANAAWNRRAQAVIQTSPPDEREQQDKLREHPFQSRNEIMHDYEPNNQRAERGERGEDIT